MASLLALGDITTHLARHSLRAKVSQSFSQELYEKMMAGIVKLLAEKLEPVRAAAARTWETMKSAGVGQVWDWPEAELVDVVLEEP